LGHLTRKIHDMTYVFGPMLNLALSIYLFIVVIVVVIITLCFIPLVIVNQVIMYTLLCIIAVSLNVFLCRRSTPNRSTKSEPVRREGPLVCYGS